MQKILETLDGAKLDSYITHWKLTVDEDLCKHYITQYTLGVYDRNVSDMLLVLSKHGILDRYDATTLLAWHANSVGYESIFERSLIMKGVSVTKKSFPLNSLVNTLLYLMFLYLIALYSEPLTIWCGVLLCATQAVILRTTTDIERNITMRRFLPTFMNYLVVY